MANVSNLSILTSIKKLLGIQEEYEHFDTDIVLNINSAFFNLNQLGVGPKGAFRIEDKTAKWDDFLQGRYDLESVKIYVFLKTRLTFDPPQMGYLIDNIKKQCEEIEWRLNVQIENHEEQEEEHV